ALAEALVALALDELEEDRPQLVLREDLQQERSPLAVDQDLALLELGHALAVRGDALVDQLVVSVHGVEQGHALGAQRVHRPEQISRAEGHVLDALATVPVQVLLNLPGLLGALLVDRDADLAARTGHGLGPHAGHLALDVEVADLAEV